MMRPPRFRPIACTTALLLSLLLVVGGGAVRAASPAAPHGTGGAVASDDPRASAVGVEILRQGGNAVDAAVATALALAVVFPEAGNLGGGGFAVVRLAPEDGREPAVASLDFREVAPAAAHREMYLDESGEPIPDASLVGPLAAGVPGSPTGLHTLHQRFGALEWSRVVAPAERLARDGFTVDRNLHDSLTEARDLLARFPETAAVWLPGGAPLPVGSIIRLPELATTLRAYGRWGPAAIIGGPTAERIEAVSGRHGGILTTEDLSAYRPAWRDPVRFGAFGWQVASMDLPSSGGAILAETFQVLERLAWGERPRFGAERAHLLAEAFRGAFADRYRMGDPSVTGVTAAEVASPEWLARRATSIEGSLRARRALASRSTPAYPGPPPDPAEGRTESQDTTHLSVVDGDGGAVALTTTLNGLFGSKAWVPGLGFLNNEMDDFAAAPGRPNLYGLVQGEANAVRPGKRMLSSMSPTIAWRAEEGEDRDADGERAGEEVLVAGGRGGSKIPTNTAQVLLHVMVDGDDLQQALDRPRLHHQWLPDRLQVEPDTLAPETAATLLGLGHRLDVTPATAKVNAARALGDGTTEAASDPRGPTRGAGAVVAEPDGLLPLPAAERAEAR